MKRIALVLALAASLAAQDIIFERGNPNAYQTLQAALDAAAPGQRVIMRSEARQLGLQPHGTIQRSVILEGQFDGFEFDLHEEGGGLRIIGATSGMRVVVRNVDFSVGYGSSYHPSAVATTDLPSADVALEDVRVRVVSGTAYWSGAMLFMQCGRLSMRRCQITAPDISATGSCCSVWRQADGIDALKFTGRVLHLEDCDLKAGNASMMSFTQPTQCFGVVCPEGGIGGSAVIADQAFCIAVRTRISDGNGGSVGDGPWPTPPVPGHPRPSRFGWLSAYDVLHEQGRSDAGGVGVPRGAVVRYGFVDAPLSIGPSRIGRPTTISVTSSTVVEPVAVALATSLGWPSPTPFGPLHISAVPPPPVILTGVGQTNLGVPDTPELVGTTLAGQLIALYNGHPSLSNPSLSVIGR